MDIGNILVPHGVHVLRTIVFASDHRGYALKKGLLDYFRSRKVYAGDIGAHMSERCDYPRLSSDLGRMISQDFMCDTVGIGICGSGIGIGIPASKWPGVYVARCLTANDARDTRKHNNTNFLALGSDMSSLDDAIQIVDAWLWEPFEIVEPYISRFLQTVELEQERCTSMRASRTTILINK